MDDNNGKDGSQTESPTKLRKVYQQAANFVNNMNSTIHRNFYLSIIFLGVILNLGYNFYSAQTPNYVWLIGLSLLCGIIFFILHIYSRKMRKAREDHKAIMEQLERELGLINPERVEIPERLEFSDDELQRIFRGRLGTFNVPIEYSGDFRDHIIVAKVVERFQLLVSVLSFMMIGLFAFLLLAH